MRRKPTTILQVNIDLYCNQACSHCHVESSPLRKEEVMSAKTANRLIELMDNSNGSIKTLDITGRRARDDGAVSPARRRRARAGA